MLPVCLEAGKARTGLGQTENSNNRSIEGKPAVGSPRTWGGLEGGLRPHRAAASSDRGGTRLPGLNARATKRFREADSAPAPRQTGPASVAGARPDRSATPEAR